MRTQKNRNRLTAPWLSFLPTLHVGQRRSTTRLLGDRAAVVAGAAAEGEVGAEVEVAVSQVKAEVEAEAVVVVVGGAEEE